MLKNYKKIYVMSERERRDMWMGELWNAIIGGAIILAILSKL